MASNVETVNFLCDQINGVGNARYKKMFGEYMVYLNDKPIFLICDDTVFIKINEDTKAFLENDIKEGYPYVGAKLHFAVDFIDDRERLQELAKLLETITPLPKQKNKRNV